jgi:DNA-binding response OmpR family regulator
VELGAEDYLFKPFNPVLLRARIGACLEKKRMRDQGRAINQAVQQLRGPLTEVKESIEKLMSGGTGLMNTDQAKLLAVIEAGVAQAFKVFGWA